SKTRREGTNSEGTLSRPQPAGFAERLLLNQSGVVVLCALPRILFSRRKCCAAFRKNLSQIRLCSERPVACTRLHFSTITVKSSFFVKTSAGTTPWTKSSAGRCRKERFPF